MQFCPMCKTSRWKDNNTTGKKVPKKVLRYFLIIPRLQHLYKSNHTTKQMTWHDFGKSTENGKMQRSIDGKSWKNCDTRYLGFAVEPRNVRLGLAADDFNQFGNLNFFNADLLIPSPKSMGKDIDVYLRPLIDDLKDLCALKGVETIDATTGKTFNMRAMLLWIINDFPARSSLSGWSRQGYMACPTCNEDTPSVRANTPTGVPYIEDQIIAMVQKGKQRGHILGVGMVLTRQARDAISINEPRGTYTDADVDELKEEAKRTRQELELLRRVVRFDDWMSQMYTQLESQHEIGGGSGSGRGGGRDEDVDGDEDANGDEDIYDILYMARFVDVIMFYAVFGPF
ncbi:hypothetical protein Tco_1027997 [Tanacetum coccineum]